MMNSSANSVGENNSSDFHIEREGEEEFIQKIINSLNRKEQQQENDKPQPFLFLIDGVAGLID